MGLALAGNTNEVISKMQLFIDTLIVNTPQIIQAGNQMQIELIQLSLSQ